MMEKIVVLTGAGISAESGISTFRDSDGLWEHYRVEDVATHEAYERNPELVLDFYNQRRRQLFAAQPNEAHRQLVRLEQRYDVRIVTQNIDDLHERAGSSHVLHLHGELTKGRSDRNPDLIVEVGNRDIKLGDKAPDGFADIPEVGKAQCQEALGSYAEALAAYEAFAEANPSSYLALTAKLGSARVLALSGDREKALQRLAEIKESVKGDAVSEARVDATEDCIKRPVAK